MNNKAMIQVDDLMTIRHMLGADPRCQRKNWGWRNAFSGSAADPILIRLEKAGLIAQRGKPSEITGGDQSYVVTEEGCDVIGLTPTQKKRALSA